MKLNKKTIIISSIVFVFTLAIVAGVFFIFWKKDKPIQIVEEQKQEEINGLPEMNIEILDLEGPNQKYINHTLGYSLELPDELEYRGGEPADRHRLVHNFFDKECLKLDGCGTMEVFHKKLNVFIYYLSPAYFENKKCTQEIVDKMIARDLGLIDGEDIVETESMRKIEKGGLDIDEVLFTKNYEGSGTTMAAYTCLSDEVFLNIVGLSNVDVSDSDRFDPLYNQFKEIISSIKLLSN